MPELPDVVLYIEALERRILDQPLSGVRLASPFLLRTAEPPIGALTGKQVRRLRRLGKRIAIGFEEDLWLVLHLMINGRLHWKPPDAKLAGRYALAAFDFPNGTLTLTEFGPKKRASLHLVQGEAALCEHDPGGLEVFEIDLEAFRARARPRQPYTEARADRPASVQRHRQRLFGRDPAPGAPVAGRDEREALRSTRPRACTRPRARRLPTGSTVCAPSTATRSRKRSPRSGRRWRCMASTGSLARSAAPRCSGSATPTTRPTTARAARPAASCWPIAPSPACCGRTGRRPSTSSSASGGSACIACRRCPRCAQALPRAAPPAASARIASSRIRPSTWRLSAVKAGAVRTSSERGRGMSTAISSLMRPGRALMT